MYKELATTIFDQFFFFCLWLWYILQVILYIGERVRAPTEGWCQIGYISVDWRQQRLVAAVYFYGCCDGVSLLWESIGAGLTTQGIRRWWSSNRLPAAAGCCWDWIVLFQGDRLLLYTTLLLATGCCCCCWDVWCCCADDVQSTIHNDGTVELMNGLPLAESIGEGAALSLNRAVICFFHLVRRFWNQVLICTSVSDKLWDNSIRLFTLKYLSTWWLSNNSNKSDYIDRYYWICVSSEKLTAI